MSGLTSVTPVLLAARAGDFSWNMQLGRVAVDFSLIALAILLILALVRARGTSLTFLLAYVVFLPFIVWWDPFEPKWFLLA